MSITPYLYYEDVDAAVNFLGRAFGFKQCGEEMRGPDGKLRHASMELDGALIMMGSPGPSYRNPKNLGTTTQSLYVHVGNADAHCARAREAGARIIEGPADTPYGHRRYGVADPEGHEWFFAHELKPANG
jgi:PhnB protein